MGENDIRNKNLIENLAVLEKWIEKNNRIGYMKLNGSSNLGCLYGLFDEKLGISINFDISVNNKAMTFEAHPGIHVVNDCLLPSIMAYCQQIETRFGLVNVGSEFREVEYHTESFIIDNKISFKTLELFEKEALNVFRNHYKNLMNLACARALELDLSVLKNQKLCPVRLFDKKRAFLKLGLLMKASSKDIKYNYVSSKKKSNGEQIYYCQLVAKNDIYRVTFQIDDSGVLILKGHHGEKALSIPNEKKYEMYYLLNDENEGNQYTASILDKNNEIQTMICTSLLDGEITDATIASMERYLIYAIQNLNPNIENLAGCGCLRIENNNLRSNQEKLNNVRRIVMREKPNNALQLGNQNTFSIGEKDYFEDEE